MHWFRQHKSCPLCKRQIRYTELYPITFVPKPKGNPRANQSAKPTMADDQTVETPSPALIPQKDGYEVLSPKEIASINSVSLPGASFGGKTDAICRHLLHLRSSHSAGSSHILNKQQTRMRSRGHIRHQHAGGNTLLAPGGAQSSLLARYARRDAVGAPRSRGWRGGAERTPEIRRER